jgi:hypothetical protein
LGGASDGMGGQGGDPNTSRDPELVEVIERWAGLPAPLRLAIMALVRSAD